MAFGTVIGSNIFNSLGVIGIASIISPFAIEPEVLQRDLPWALGLTLLFYLLARFSARGIFTRSHGILLLLLYVSYLWHISATTMPNQ